MELVQRNWVQTDFYFKNDMLKTLLLRLYGLVSNLPVLGEAFERVRDWKSLRFYQQQGYYSQHQEDLFLKEYFGDRIGNYIDIGANHPFRLSNTYLLYLSGWKGITVEPILQQLAAHQRMRPRDQHVNLAIGSKTGELTFYQLIPASFSTLDKSVYEDLRDQGLARLRREYKVPVVTLRELFETHLGDKRCDLLSVDTEGLDFDILASNDWNKFRPKIVICEANSESEAADCQKLLLENGYRELKRLGCNLIFESIN